MQYYFVIALACTNVQQQRRQKHCMVFVQYADWRYLYIKLGAIYAWFNRFNFRRVTWKNLSM